jgi:hypothetical protein
MRWSLRTSRSTIAYGLALYCFTAATLQAQQTAEQLRAEIAQLQKDIDPLVALRIGQPATVRVDLSVAPLTRLFNHVTTLQPEIGFSFTGLTGQIVSWGSDCYLGPIKTGSVAAFAEFPNVNGGGVWLKVLRTVATWVPATNAVRFDADVSEYAFVPTIRTYFDLTCPGGGRDGPQIGPISLFGPVQSSTRLGLSAGSDQLFGLTATIDVRGKFEICPSLGELDKLVGRVCIPLDVAKQVDWSGQLGGPTLVQGQIELPAAVGGGLLRNYRIDLSR